MPFAGDLLVAAAVVLAVDRGDEVAAVFLALFAVLIALLALNNAQHLRLQENADADEPSDATARDEAPPEGGATSR